MPLAEYNRLVPKAAAKTTLTIKVSEESNLENPDWYIDGRNIDGGKVTFTCYDRIAFKDDIKADFTFTEGTEYIQAGDLIGMISVRMGLSGWEPCGISGTEIHYPVTSIETRSCGDILSDLSNILCCYFCIDNGNTLCAVGIGADYRICTITDYTELKGVIPYTIKCCELTDSAGNVCSAGIDASGTETIQNSCGNISKEELTEQAEKQINKTYTAWTIEKAAVGQVLELGTKVFPYENKDDNTLIANNISLKINSCGIIASIGAAAISGGEIGKYMGRLSRLAENAVKTGDRLGKHLLVTRYQGLLWIDGDEDD